jgi:hypothetical protein
MKPASKNRTAEVALGRRSQKLAEDESRLVARDLLDEAITKFLEWRAFSYWLRLCVETDGTVSGSLAATLQDRCPGFLEYAAAYARQHPMKGVPLASLLGVDRRKAVPNSYC